MTQGNKPITLAMADAKADAALKLVERLLERLMHKHVLNLSDVEVIVNGLIEGRSSPVSLDMVNLLEDMTDRLAAYDWTEDAGD